MGTSVWHGRCADFFHTHSQPAVQRSLRHSRLVRVTQLGTHPMRGRMHWRARGSALVQDVRMATCGAGAVTAHHRLPIVTVKWAHVLVVTLGCTTNYDSRCRRVVPQPPRLDVGGASASQMNSHPREASPTDVRRQIWLLQRLRKTCPDPASPVNMRTRFVGTFAVPCHFTSLELTQETDMREETVARAVCRTQITRIDSRSTMGCGQRRRRES